MVLSVCVTVFWLLQFACIRKQCWWLRSVSPCRISVFLNFIVETRLILWNQFHIVESVSLEFPICLFSLLVSRFVSIIHRAGCYVLVCHCWFFLFVFFYQIPSCLFTYFHSPIIPFLFSRSSKLFMSESVEISHILDAPAKVKTAIVSFDDLQKIQATYR